jgi:hypothetical protein
VWWGFAGPSLTATADVTSEANYIPELNIEEFLYSCWF